MYCHKMTLRHLLSAFSLLLHLGELINGSPHLVYAFVVSISCLRRLRLAQSGLPQTIAIPAFTFF